MNHERSKLLAKLGGRRGGLSLVVAAAGFFGGVLWTTWMNQSTSGRVIAQWAQPATVAYESFDPYTLHVVEVGKVRSLLAQRATHEIRIIRGHDSEGYGYYLGLSLDGDDADVRNSTVTWDGDGVTLATPSEHRIFIPKRAFVGGR